MLGVTIGVAGIVGTWLGGYLADRFGSVDRRHMLTTPAIGLELGAPILFLGYWVDEWHIAIALIFIPTVFTASYYGTTFACVHGLVRHEASGLSSEIQRGIGEGREQRSKYM